MKTTGQDLLDQATAMEAEILQSLAPTTAAQNYATPPSNPVTTAGLTLEELEDEILRLDEDRSSQATQLAESLKLEPLDHLRVCALAKERGRTAQQILHDLLQHPLLLAERDTRKVRQ